MPVKTYLHTGILTLRHCESHLIDSISVMSRAGWFHRILFRTPPIHLDIATSARRHAPASIVRFLRKRMNLMSRDAYPIHEVFSLCLSVHPRRVACPYQLQRDKVWEKSLPDLTP